MDFISSSNPPRSRAMTLTTKPSKEATRAYLQDRIKAKTPPPVGNEIRRQLGWFVLPNNKCAECAR